MAPADLEAVERGTNATADVHQDVDVDEEQAACEAPGLAMAFADHIGPDVGGQVTVTVGGQAFDVPIENVQYANLTASGSTIRAYRSDWADWIAHCSSRNVSSCPAAPGDVADYIASLTAAGKAPATIQRRLSAIARAHELVGQVTPTDSPIVRMTMSGMRRTSTRKETPALPIGVDLLTEMVKATIGKGPATLRDRAILTTGWWSALKREQLAALKMSDVLSGPDGDSIIVRNGSEGGSDPQPIPSIKNSVIDPVSTLRRWQLELSILGVTSGPLFVGIDQHGNASDRSLTPASINAIVKRAVALAGENPEGYSSHSLRVGHVAFCREMLVPDHLIVERTGLRDEGSLARYRGHLDPLAVGLLISKSLTLPTKEAP